MLIKEVVFDTNTWVSFFYNAQFVALTEIKFDKKIVIYSCTQQELELAQVLVRPKFKKKLNLPLEEYIEFFRGIATIIDVQESFDRVEDPKDNYIIDTAYTGKADHVISSDRHVLSLKHVGKIQIISLTAFKKAMDI